jgi:hypothetical protein
MLSESIFKIKSFNEEECIRVTKEDAIRLINLSKSCFILLAQKNGPTEMLFKAMNEETFNDFVVMMCYNPKLLKFLKLAVISSEKILKRNKKGMNFAAVAADYIKANLSFIV